MIREFREALIELLENYSESIEPDEMIKIMKLAVKDLMIWKKELEEEASQ